MYILGRKDSWKKEFEDRPRPRRKIKRIKTTRIEPYLNDYAFFALSPLYVHAGVAYSMPDQFELEAGPQDRILVDYQRVVIGGLGRWGHFIEGMHKDVWEDFCHYLGTVMFYSERREVIWFIRPQEINMEGTKNNTVVDPSRLPVRLRVFLPDGNKGRMYIKSGYPAKLWWNKPHAKVIEAAEAVVACKGRIEDGR